MKRRSPIRTSLHTLALALLAAVALGLAASQARAQVPQPADISAMEAAMERALGLTTRIGVGDSELEAAARTAAEAERLAAHCISTTQSEIDRLRALLGAEPATPAENGATPAPAPQNSLSAGRIGELEEILAACRELVLDSDTIATRIEQVREQRTLQELASRGRSVFETLVAAATREVNWNALGRPIERLLELPPFPASADWLIVSALAAAGFGLGWRVRRWGGPGAAFAPLILGFTGVMVGATFAYAAAMPTLLVMAWQALALVCIALIASALPAPPEQEESGGSAVSGWQLGAFLLSVLFVHHVASAFANALPIPEVELARVFGFVLVTATALPVTRSLSELALLGSGWKAVRAVFVAGFAAALLSEFAGYRALAGILLSGLAGTLAAAVFYALIERGGDALFATLNSGDARWSRRFKRSLGFPPHEPVPGLFWLRLFFEIIVFFLFALAVTTSWGLDRAGRDLALRYAIDGFELWGITFLPGRILGGILVFSLLMMVGRRVRDLAERKWLATSQIDPGGRGALVTLIGYAGIIIAVTAGLAWAGLNFDNIAIVAGALSVGIGFGLQNIVNNFVSGLILLFERPIRPGDWIVIGGTEGIVRKISVRATEIQTFDRTDVIVPNADLISNQVTNFTLRNQVGRVVIQIGVAYGSDTELVHRLLTEVAAAHPDVTDGTLAPAPLVTFAAFGDSALVFELRAWIRNVVKRLPVTSDLNFAIDKAFREHGIEIPFPQRVVSLRHENAPTQGDGD